VQVIPHVTDLIKRWIKEAASLPVDDTNKPPEIVLIEVGGTVGDIESGSYFEALRQMILDLGHNNVCLCMITYVPTFASGE